MELTIEWEYECKDCGKRVIRRQPGDPVMEAEHEFMWCDVCAGIEDPEEPELPKKVDMDIGTGCCWLTCCQCDREFLVGDGTVAGIHPDELDTFICQRCPPPVDDIDWMWFLNANPDMPQAVYIREYLDRKNL